MNQKNKFVSKVMSALLSLTLLVSAVMPVSAFVAPTDKNVSASLVDGFSKYDNKYEIYPMPHTMDYGAPQSFTLNGSINLVVGEGVDEYTKKFLTEILDAYALDYVFSESLKDSGNNISLSINKSDDALFEKIDAYSLSAHQGNIVIVGKDTDSVFHGLATLQMMFSSFAGKKFLSVDIEDWAEMEHRGVIEGFYGAWDHEERMSLMKSSRDVKMNTMVYAAKGDKYHRELWDQLYPAEEIAQMAELAQVGEETKVRFAWSVHLEHFFRGGVSVNGSPDRYQERFDKLIAKFEQLYDVGVRRFDVMNDDFGSGSNEDVVVLLNQIMSEFVDLKGDVEPIIFTPQGYNVAWAGDGSELAVLSTMDPRIKVYWTGWDVNSPIEQGAIDSFYNSVSNKLEPVYWLNYPVNEHAKSGIYLGDISHYARDEVTGLAGALSNPSWFAETNKVGLFQLASLFWNNQNYSDYGLELWEDSFKYLQPEVYESYLTIARNVANAPDSGRVPRGFPESEYIKDRLEAVLADLSSGSTLTGSQDVASLFREFDAILFAIEDFRVKVDNETLKVELEPWLKSLEDVVVAGDGALKAVLALEALDIDGAWSNFFKASKAMSTWDSNGIFPGGGVVAKSGTKRLLPFANTLIGHVSKKLTPILNPNGSFAPAFMGRMGGSLLQASANTEKMMDGKDTTYASFQTVQQKDDYFGLDLGKSIPIHDLKILQGQHDSHHDYFHKATLEHSKDGESWTTLVPLIDATRIEMDKLDFEARYVRLRLTETGTASKPDYWTFVRSFEVNSLQAENDVYTNVEGLKNASIHVDGATYTLTPNNNQVTLPAQAYLGLALPEVKGVSAISVNPDLSEGLVLEYSVNQALWFDVSSLEGNTAMRYVRIKNTSDKDLSFDLTNLTVSLDAAKMELKYHDSNLSRALRDGAWENLFDGKINTIAWTNEDQVAGQYIIFDVGALMPLHDVKLISTDEKARIYNGTLSVSKDKTSWTDLAVIENDDAPASPGYKHIAGNADGEMARYIRFRVDTTPAGQPYLKLHELEVNKDVAALDLVSAFSGNPQGNFNHAMDNDLVSIFTPGLIDIDDAYFEYLISDSVKVKDINILQDPSSLSKAVLKVQNLKGEWINLGSLDKSVNAFDTRDVNGVQKLRLEWVKGSKPAIAEIFITSDAWKDQDAGTEEDLTLVHPNLVSIESVESISVPNGTSWDMVGLPENLEVQLSNGFSSLLPVTWTATNYQAATAGTYEALGTLTLPSTMTNPLKLQASSTVTIKAEAGEDVSGNLALNQTVEVSGTEGTAFPAEAAVDGDMNTRWSGNKMKDRDDMDPSNQTAGANWIVVDVGEGDLALEKLEITYHAKASGTKYLIQVSNDKSEWTSIAEVNKAANDEQNATHIIPVEANHAQGRYIRVLFNELNVNARAATGVSIKELKILGSQSFGEDLSISSIAVQKTSGDLGSTFADLDLPKKAVVKLADGSSLSLPVLWDQEAYDANSLAEQSLSGILELSDTIENPENLKAELKLSLKAPAQVLSALSISLTVPYDTSFSALNLPEKTIVELDNGFAIIVDLEWMAGDFDGQKAGEYQLKGNLILPDKVKNDSEIQAKAQVTVEAYRVTLEDATLALNKAEASLSQSDLDEAQALINALPESSDRSNLQTILNKVQESIHEQAKLAQANAALKEAEAAKTEASIQKAQEAIDKLKDSAEKTSLQDRLDAIFTHEEAALKAAKSAVTEAEKTKTQASIDAAQVLVTQLPAGEDKILLQERLDALVSLEDLALANAEQAVSHAEKTQSKASLEAAQVLVDKLADSAEKLALQKRLNAIKTHEELALLAANQAVEEAENLQTNAGKKAAQVLIDKLVSSAEKIMLQARLDALVTHEDKALEVARDAVELAESLKSESSIMSAQTLIDALENSPAKTDLQKRLDAIVTHESDALSLASQAVEEAEKSQSDASRHSAQVLIDKLPDSDDKSKLQARLDVIITHEDMAYEKAIEAIEAAEKEKSNASRSKAEYLINQITDTKLRESLFVRLAELVTHEDAAFQAANLAVKKVEKSLSQKDFDKAQALVDALDDELDKKVLQEMLDKVLLEIKAKDQLPEKEPLEKPNKEDTPVSDKLPSTGVSNALTIMNLILIGAGVSLKSSVKKKKIQ